MTKVLSFRSAAFALMLTPIAACAQPAARQAPAGGAASGGVTLQQYVQRHERKLLAADTDGDGRVSRDEFLAAAKAGKGDPAKRFARIDRNGDGMLDKAEIDAMLAKRFARLDSNGDGVLSPAERAAAHDKSRVAGDGAES
ncbi:EF-hand domain-containing protein [Glacieibacterium megasporae]|uniref:EF-hand domain-containing protein n=1 Tax=Glacieibacterium megasporae TaxID=2835787 RepID=UPI001C1DD8F9|nr:EF-hand domain-containing protein [Polymorphobacter megasporae]UAJ11302.1 EF-hand domain-containing protein [Polymorphobacter megasporae]